MDWLITLALVFPVPIPATAPPCVWDSLQRVALRLELVGPHERWATDFRSEVGYCRIHLSRLWDAPRMSDCQRMPNCDAAAEACRLNAVYQQSLHTRRMVELHHYAELSAAIQDAIFRQSLWDDVRTTQAAGSWVSKRSALARLRDYLGEGYYRGELPPPVPWESFTLID